MATIAVTVTAQGEVSAVENPHTASPADLVTWVFKPVSKDNLRVVFTRVELASGSGALLNNQQGPFSQPLSMSGGEISGTIAKDAPNGRYLYEIHNSNNEKLKWLTPLGPGQEFGGLDIPKPPPVK